MRLAALLTLLLGTVTPLAATAKPSVSTLVTDRYAFDRRLAGDGAPIVQVADEVPEPLFLYLNQRRFIVWWRARSSCDKSLQPKVKLQGDTLVLDVTTAPQSGGCEQQATVFETVVEDWGEGPREVKSDGAEGRIASLWVSAPSPSRPKELGVLGDRVRERDALRRLGERIAWRYHLEGEPRAAVSAYRWLIMLDELHWRAPLYHARIFHNAAAYTRTKGTAIAALEALLPGLERLRARVAQPATTENAAEHAEMKRELAGLEAFLEPALRYLALRWHNEAAFRWHSPSRAYHAYLRAFPTSPSAPLLRFYYAAALLQTDDTADASAQYQRAAVELDDKALQELAAACAIVLELEDFTRKQLAPCRTQKPALPEPSLFPKAANEQFARGGLLHALNEQ